MGIAPKRTRHQRLGVHVPHSSKRAEPLPWAGGYVWEGQHAFTPHCYAKTQCGRCWGWVDDARHLGTDRE